MDNLIVQDKGYTVIYETSKGDIGFIGIDDHSGGYPYFSSSVEWRNVFKTVGAAQSLLQSGLKMGTYFGADKVHFGTMRVVQYSHVFVDVDIDQEKILFEQAVEKLTNAELDAIKRHLAGEKT